MQKTPTQAAACAIAPINISAVEQTRSSPQERLLSFSDLYETANGEDALESEPLLANNSAPSIET